jgi:hypothetical protein
MLGLQGARVPYLEEYRVDILTLLLGVSFGWIQREQAGFDRLMGRERGR